LADERLHDGVVLGDLSGKILLALEQGGDVALKLDELTGDGFNGTGTDKTSSKSAGQNGGAEDSNLTSAHEQSS
jgi:hypothetical protein